MEKIKPCRDYEEQGFCVYGETCQYSHGTNPVVLDGVNAGLILTSTVSTTAITGSTNTISTTHQSRNINSSISRRSGIKKRLGGGDRNSSGFSSQNRNNDGGHPQNHHNNNNNNNRHHHSNNHHHHHQNHNNSSSNNNYRHSGGASNTHRHSNNNSQQNNDKCTLEVRRVPQHQNTIKDMNEHFSKFGTIVNLQVNYEGDPEGALIQYSSPHEAIAAYRSPEAVFNNRFIRVHWHFKSDLSINASDPAGQDKRSHNDDGEDTTNNSSSDHQATDYSDHQNETTNSSKQKGQPSTLNRHGKKRSVMMRLGSKPDAKNTSAATAKYKNQTTEQGDDDSNDEPPAKQAPHDPDGSNPTMTATNNNLVKSRRESSLHNKQQQQQGINNANDNKKKVQKQGVEIQRKQSDLLTNLIHQQKILIKKIESSTEEKERASLKSILDELTQKTKDLMTKTSLKQNMIRSNQPINQATTANTPTSVSSLAPTTVTITNTTTTPATSSQVASPTAKDDEGTQFDADRGPEPQQSNQPSCSSDLEEALAETEGATV